MASFYLPQIIFYKIKSVNIGTIMYHIRLYFQFKSKIISCNLVTVYEMKVQLSHYLQLKVKILNSPLSPIQK